MLENNFTGFLAQLALATFEVEMKREAEKIYKMEEALRWEKRKQSFRSSLSVLLESADLTRREMRYVMTDIKEDGPDELLQKIRFVTDRMSENPDPAKQFKERMRSKFL